MVKCLPAMRETWVRSLGWEDPLEKEMATHSSSLAWNIPWTEEWGRKESDTTEQLHFQHPESYYSHFIHIFPAFPFFQQTGKVSAATESNSQ